MKPKQLKLQTPKPSHDPRQAIIGIDEVGRGCWAGPLCVGAVYLPAGYEGFFVDSKAATPKQRAILASQILRVGYVGLGWQSAADIDRLGLTLALRAATTIALAQLPAQLVLVTPIIVDGTINFADKYPQSSTLIRADGQVPAVMAASIVAKVARDAFMIRIASAYGAFGFQAHKGYGTEYHRQALLKHGVTPLHRKSFKPIATMTTRYEA